LAENLKKRLTAKERLILEKRLRSKRLKCCSCGACMQEKIEIGKIGFFDTGSIVIVYRFFFGDPWI
jgi:hypothetical protein